MNADEENDKLFNEVVDLMISSKKPLIVHNGYLDLMHVNLISIRYIIGLSRIYRKPG